MDEAATAAEAPIEQVGLDPAVVAEVIEALDAAHASRVEALVDELYYADLADLIETLSPDRRRALIEILRRRFPTEILPELAESVRDAVVDQLGAADLATALAKLESDDALYLIQDLQETARSQVLHAIPAALRRILEEGLNFPEESAGRLMSRDLVAVPAYWTVGECIDDMRTSDDLPDEFYDLFVVDPRHRPVGTVPLHRLVRSVRSVKVGEIMDSEVQPVPVTMDQEDVAFLFKQHDLTSAPIVDGAGRLIGTITVDDVVDVIEEEAEEDLLHLGLVGESDIHSAVLDTAKRRIRWLGVTLVNTILAATVISQFEATLEQMVALAVLMPIVAAMGGNAGMQVVTVTVRALATRDLSPANAMRVVGKELAVGCANGVVFASVMGTAAAVWSGNPALGLVLAAAMVFNMCWAGLAGTLIPIAIHRLDHDPAIVAGPFLTTTTDILGFFVFLGLATLVLL